MYASNIIAVTKSAQEPQYTSSHSPSLTEQPSPYVDPGNGIPNFRLNLTRRVRRAWNYGWVAEILCCTLAIISLIAIVITLRLHQDKPLPQWPLGITINALIAIFGVLLKAGLIVPLSEGISQLKWQWFQKQPRKLIDMDDFDVASRGAWGSFLFLFTTNARRSAPQGPVCSDPRAAEKTPHSGEKGNSSLYLAKLAALLTVLAVAVDPFAQQIIVYLDCPQLSQEFYSSIARTNKYNATGEHIGAGEGNIDNPMGVAINTGTVDPPKHIPSLVSTECKSGNCTFPDFSTVGVCHSCDDLSSQIRNITIDYESG